MEQTPHVCKIGLPETDYFDHCFQCEECSEGNIQDIYNRLSDAWHAVIFQGHRTQV